MNGQAANAFGQGMMQGYGFMDKMANSAQVREINDEKLINAKSINNARSVITDNLSKEQKQLEAAKTANAATQQTQQFMAQQGYAATNEQSQQAEMNKAMGFDIESLKASQMKQNGNVANGLMTPIATANTLDERRENLTTAVSQMKTNPDIPKTLKLGNLDAIRVLDVNDPKDNKFLMDYAYDTYGLDITTMPKERGDEVLNSLRETLSIVNAPDEKGKLHYVSMENLLVGTGGVNTMSVPNKKKMEVNAEQVRDVVSSAQPQSKQEEIARIQQELDAEGFKATDMTGWTEEQKMAHMAKLQSELDAEENAEGKPSGSDSSNMPEEVVMDVGTSTSSDTPLVKEQGIKAGAEAMKPDEQVALQKVVADKQATGSRMEEDDLKQWYALAGMNYPLDKATTKIQNHEFLTKQGVPTEVATDLIFGKTKSDRMDSYTQSATAFRKGKPNATKEEWEEFNANWATKSVAGVSEVKEQRDLKALQQNFTDSAKYKNQYLNNPSSATSSDMGVMKNIENSNYQNLKPKQQTQLDASTTDMKNRHRTVNAVNSLVNDLESGKLKGAKRGPIDNIINSAKKIIGSDKLTAEQEESMNKAINRDTRTGMILANFLRATSGLTVTEEERTFLTDIMTGGNWSDEETLMTAIKGFRDQNIEENDVIAGTLFDDAGYSATKYRQYDTYDTAKAKDNVTNVPNEASKAPQVTTIKTAEHPKWRYNVDPVPEGYDVMVKRDADGNVIASKLVKAK